MGSLPGDSCIHQLLAVSHGIFLNFDCNATLETEGAFLDISKTLDRVWHDGLLFKLKQNGVPGNLFQLVKSFLSGRFQRVLHNGQLLYWETIQIGVPDNSNSNLKLFAGDASFFRDLWSFRDCKCTKQWLKKNSQMGRTIENGF